MLNIILRKLLSHITGLLRDLRDDSVISVKYIQNHFCSFFLFTKIILTTLKYILIGSMFGIN